MRWQFVASARAGGAADLERQTTLACLGREDDRRSPEIEELIVPSARLGPTVPIVWLACLIAACGTVAGLGLVGRGAFGAGSGGGAASRSPILRAVAAASPSLVGRPPAPRLSRHRVEITILTPGPGEVVLGSVVPVAGFVAVSGAPRGIAWPTDVHVAINHAGAILGETMLPVVDGRFIGWVQVVAPVRASTVEIQVWDAHRTGRASESRRFVLQLGSANDLTGKP